MEPTIRPANGEADVAEIRRLLRDYAASLPVDLAFQGFAAEIAALPGDYAPPAGTLLLAHADVPAGRAAAPAIGCIGVRPLARPGACEMKRLFVAPAGRGRGVGRALATASLVFARRAGYREMLLDTLPSMRGAMALYHALGFEETGPYGSKTGPAMLYFRRDLAAG